MFDTGLPPTGAQAKNRGAYYTDEVVARFLVRWAVRDRGDQVIDPSFGAGVFLTTACRRIEALGGQPMAQVHGVELDQDAYQQVLEAMAREGWSAGATLHQADFFTHEPARRFDCVVGNPPFIRYQRFSGGMREQALRQAEALGAKLPALSSSWAPFLVKGAALLGSGGRLAMVAPMELGHAAYALPVLDYFHRSFGRVTFLTFRTRLFPDLSEDTLLLLADDYGGAPSEFQWADLPSAEALDRFLTDEVLRRELKPIGTRAMLRGERRLLHHLLDSETLKLYSSLQGHAKTRRLGALADVGIGYVTGANDFFHLHPAKAESLGIEKRFLRRAVRRGRSLKGILYTTQDWSEGLPTEESGELLHLPSGTQLTGGLARYLEDGVRKGVDQRYKCRVRPAWYCVPNVYEPRAFLTYMSGGMPRLVANQAHAVATNSLHVLRALPDVEMNPEELALFWHTSLTWLSAELEGHAMGGGMLKLEPTEAERVLVAIPSLAAHRISPLAQLADALMRCDDFEGVLAHLDLEILEAGLGLSRDECRRLRSGAELLSDRRSRVR